MSLELPPELDIEEIINALERIDDVSSVDWSR